MAYDENNDAAAATALMHRGFFVCDFYKVALGLETARRQCLGGVVREAWLTYDYVVELVLEEVGALTTSMSIIDSEIAAFGPLFNVGAISWLRYVQDYRDSVLVVITRDSLVCVGSI